MIQKQYQTIYELATLLKGDYGIGTFLCVLQRFQEDLLRRTLPVDWFWTTATENRSSATTGILKRLPSCVTIFFIHNVIVFFRRYSRHMIVIYDENLIKLWWKNKQLLCSKYLKAHSEVWDNFWQLKAL